MTKAKTLRLCGIILSASLFAGGGGASVNSALPLRQRLADAGAGVMVVAHRGCHAAAPRHGLPSAPENSLQALDHCIAMGVDMMETDVRRTRDGHLVMMHDAKVDRTTDGSGNVSDMTLAEIKGLHLRADLGGATAALTDQRVPTLTEMLRYGGGRILFNLDIQEAIYGEVIDEAVRGGFAQDVLLKTRVGPASQALASIPPYDRVPFMPILTKVTGTPDEIVAQARRQLSARRRPVSFGTPQLGCPALTALAHLARKGGVRLWTNSLQEGYYRDGPGGGDAQALVDPDRVWGRLIRAGFSMIQTDQPEALKDFAARYPNGRATRIECR